VKLVTAEFEEGEYRGPLFNQLATNQFVWEPGQVFEQYIGIDYALLCTHPAVAKLYGWQAALRGVQLLRYDFDYIWRRRNSRKRLPPFQLNMFIQAKRPQYTRRAPKALKTIGLGSPYWQFDLTAHQQIALEQLGRQLGSKALVTYAAPAFHTSADLYRHTINKSVVEASTFPEVTALSGHQAWNYSEPGNQGIANAEPERIVGLPLVERIAVFTQTEQSQLDAPSNLSQVAAAVSAAVEVTDDFWQARFQDGLTSLDEALDDAELGERRASTRQFLKTMWFCHVFRASWFVVGPRRETIQ
jgi:hypothetical protein